MCLSRSRLTCRFYVTSLFENKSTKYSWSPSHQTLEEVVTIAPRGSLQVLQPAAWRVQLRLRLPKAVTWRKQCWTEFFVRLGFSMGFSFGNHVQLLETSSIHPCRGRKVWCLLLWQTDCPGRSDCPYGAWITATNREIRSNAHRAIWAVQRQPQKLLRIELAKFSSAKESIQTRCFRMNQQWINN